MTRKRIETRLNPGCHPGEPQRWGEDVTRKRIETNLSPVSTTVDRTGWGEDVTRKRIETTNNYIHFHYLLSGGERM